MPSIKRKQFSWWKIIYCVIGLSFLYLIYLRRKEVVDIFFSMNKVNHWFLVVALLFQIGIFVSQSFAYSKIYTIFGMRMKWTRMFWVLLKSFFLSVIAPSGGFLIGIGVVMDDGRKMGLSKTKLLLANVVYWVVYYAVFIFFLLILIITRQ